MAKYEIKLITQLQVSSGQEVSVSHELTDTKLVNTNDIVEEIKKILKDRKDVSRVSVNMIENKAKK